MLRTNLIHSSLDELSPSGKTLLTAAGIFAIMTMPSVSNAQNTVNEPPAITVNIFNERHPINPYVYGGNFPNTDTDFIEKTGTRLSRNGGNVITCHNWKDQIHNTAADWFFENFKDDSNDMQWIEKIQKHGSAAMIGIAMVDWTPKAPGLASFSVKKYGKQEKTDPYRPDNGNGMTPDGKKIKNDPNDAYVPLRDHPSPGDAPGTIYRDEWIKELSKAYGNFPHFYEFDNEPEIWAGTHRDIHPEGSTYNEMRDKYLQMARLIKPIDPKAKLLGPTVCGPWFYWNSGAGGGDKDAHGGMDYLPWWLGSIAADARKTGVRTLDYFDIHAYAEYNGNGKPEEATASRLRSPRSYWDPTFRWEGAFGDKTDLSKTQPVTNYPAIIPRFRAMVNAIYPGTGMAITEWGYFNDNDVACSLAEADTYGIFGREKLDISTKFCSPPDKSYCSLSLEMYKDFGSTSVENKTNVDPNSFSSYAALSTDNKRLTMMVINKDAKNSVTAQLKLNGFKATTMTAYERSGSDKEITKSAAINAPASYTFKPYSQTLLVFEGVTAKGVVDWAIDKDALMMITGSKAVLNVNTNQKKGDIKILEVTAPAGITMTVKAAKVAKGHPGVINVVAGTKPGFYPFSVTGKTSTGNIETQSGWILIGIPGSLPTNL